MADNIDVASLNRELNKAAQAARDLAAEHSNLASSLRQQSGKAATALDGLNDNIRTTDSNLTRTNKLQKKAMESMEKETKLRNELASLQEEANKLIAEGNTQTEKFTEIQRKLIDTQKKIDGASKESAGSLGNLRNHTGKLGRTTKIADAALVLFGSTISKGIQELREQYRATSGVVEGSGNLFGDLMSQQWDALKKGMSPSEYQKITAHQRQAMNAMGGTTAAVDQLTPAIDRFRILTGDNAKALELATQSAHDFAAKGIRPSASAISAYTDDITMMTKLTGKSAEASRQFYDDIADDADSIHMLRSAREGEREAILQSQRALVQQSIAAGMSAEQAKLAAKMLNKMVAAKPLERLKQAAKVRALGAAMGVSGSEQAAQAIIAGPRASAEQKQQLQQFNQTMTNAVDAMAGKGLGSEIFASALTDKMGLEEQYGPASPFSTTLGDTMRPTQDALNKLYETSSTQQGKMVGLLTLISGMVGVITSGAFLPAAIAMGVIGAGPKLAAILKNVLEGLGGNWGDGPSGKGGKGGKGGKLGKLGKFGGKLMSGAKGGIGGLVGGLALDYASEALTSSGHTNLGAAAGVGSSAAKWAGTGALVGSVIPGLGTLAGGAVGGALGGAYGLYENWNKFGATPATSSSKPGTDTPTETDSTAINALTSTSDGISKQIEQMTTSNDLLQRLNDMSAKQIELAEKQLIALTMTEKERSDTTNRSTLRSDSKFGAQYGYV